MKLAVAEAWLRLVNARDALTRDEFEQARVALEHTPVARQLFEHAVVALPKSRSKDKVFARQQRELLAELLASARKIEQGKLTPESILDLVRRLL